MLYFIMLITWAVIWGFLFGFIAFIVACAKPVVYQESAPKNKQVTSWICKACGYKNPLTRRSYYQCGELK